MKVNQPVVRILRKIRTEDGTSALTVLVRYLNDVEELEIKEIAALLEIGDGSVYKMLRK